jgi:hypothetical protein
MDYKIIDKIPTDTIILTFINYKYAPLFKAFYKYFKQHNLDNLLVICLDKESQNELLCQGIRTIFMDYTINDICEFWRFRLTIINNIFKYSEKNIIHTDVDCFWLKNIVTVFDALPDYDVISHVAFGHPIQIVEQLGFVMCCGLYLLRYSKNTMNFLDKILAQNLNFVDDQVYFNHYIYTNYKLIEHGTINDVLYKKILLNDSTKIGILKPQYVSREYYEDLYCFHPVLDADTMEEKLRILSKYLEIDAL